jgi:hypothetical protein
MLRKAIVLTTLATLSLTSVNAQSRNYRKEREALAKEQKEERRREREQMLASRPSIDYNTNIIRLAPLTAMDLGVGFGLSYEKIFGEEKMIGVILPVSLLLDQNNDYSPWGNGDNRYNTYFYFHPGLKIYPFGQRRVTYAVGPNLMLGYGGGKHWIFDPNTNTQYLSDRTRLRVGMLVNNYVNFNISSAFSLGLEAGLGVLYIDRETIERAPGGGSQTNSRGITATGQFSMTMGFRF